MSRTDTDRVGTGVSNTYRTTKGEVVSGMLDLGSNMGAAGCHHNRRGYSACGGCYLRLSNAIDEALGALEAGDDAGPLTRGSAASQARKILQASIDQRLAEKPKPDLDEDDDPDENGWDEEEG